MCRPKSLHVIESTLLSCTRLFYGSLKHLCDCLQRSYDIYDDINLFTVVLTLCSPYEGCPYSDQYKPWDPIGIANECTLIKSVCKHHDGRTRPKHVA